MISKRDLLLALVPQYDIIDESMSIEDVLRTSTQKPAIPPSDIEYLIAITLGTCGFKDKTELVSVLSGEWKKRLAIARALAQKPDVLFLDGPTNHLDISGICWLENLLAKAKGRIKAAEELIDKLKLKRRFAKMVMPYYFVARKSI